MAHATFSLPGAKSRVVAFLRLHLGFEGTVGSVCALCLPWRRRIRQGDLEKRVRELLCEARASVAVLGRRQLDETVVSGW